MKNHKLLWSAPFGASLLIATIPGPCTTFDDVTPPTVDAAVEDTSPVNCGPTLDLAFYSAPADAGCAELLNGIGQTGCCQVAGICAGIDACAGYLECVDDCSVVDASKICIGNCGKRWDASSLDKYTDPLQTCAKRNLPDACLGPFN